jgi:hypothetical protein
LLTEYSNKVIHDPIRRIGPIAEAPKIDPIPPSNKKSPDMPDISLGNIHILQKVSAEAWLVYFYMLDKMIEVSRYQLHHLPMGVCKLT